MKLGENMKILALEKESPDVKPEQFVNHLKLEAQKIWELYQEGIIREIYFRQDHSEAVLILESSNTEEANRLLNSLPLVEAGLITFEVIPLIPYPGFSRLFAEK
jgi:muconolactone delta-isomerase